MGLDLAARGSSAMKICFLWTFIFVQIFVGKGTEEDLSMDWEENVNDAPTIRKHAPFAVSGTVLSNNIS